MGEERETGWEWKREGLLGRLARGLAAAAGAGILDADDAGGLTILVADGGGEAAGDGLFVGGFLIAGVGEIDAAGDGAGDAVDGATAGEAVVDEFHGGDGEGGGSASGEVDGGGEGDGGFADAGGAFALVLTGDNEVVLAGDLATRAVGAASVAAVAIAGTLREQGGQKQGDHGKFEFHNVLESKGGYLTIASVN